MTTTRLTFVLLLAVAASFFSLRSVAQPTWANAFQSNPNQEALISSTATDARGNVYVTGSLTGQTSFGSFSVGNTAGGLSGFVAKRNGLTGQWLWATATDGASEVQVTGIAVDAVGNVYMSGGFGGTVSFGSQTFNSPAALTGFVAQLTSAGQWGWVERIGGGTSDTNVLRMALNPAGTTLYATALFDGTTQVGSASYTSAGSSDALVFALATTTGQPIWSRAGGGPGSDLAEGVAVDAAGAVYVVGGFEGIGTFGTTTLTGGAFYTPFVARLDPSTGNWQWVTGPGPVEGECYSIAVSPFTGQLAAAGYFSGMATFGTTTLTSQGDSDVLLAFLDPATGAWQGAAQASPGSGQQASAYDVAATGTGFVLAGSFSGGLLFPGGPGPLPFNLTSAGGTDVFVARYVGGTTGWYDALSAGGSGDEEAYGIAVMPDSLISSAGAWVHLGGYFTSPTAAFGAATLTNTITGPMFTGGPMFLAEARFGPLLLGTPDAPESAAFTLAPNPAATAVRLTRPASAAPLAVVLLDALGRSVRRATLAAGQRETTLDLHGLAAGLYVVRAGAASRRLVVE